MKNTVEALILHLRKELATLEIASQQVEDIRVRIAETRRCKGLIESAVAFEVRPIPSYVSREVQVFQVGISSDPGFRDLVLKFLEATEAKLQLQLEEAVIANQKV